MKILFISSWFPNRLEPTNGNFVQRHAQAVALKHEVEILHAIGDFNQKEKFIFDDQMINGIRTLIVYYKNTNNPATNFLRRMKAYKLGFSKLKKPDLVHANVLHNNMLFAVYLKKKYKIPFVVTEHWTALQKDNHAKTSQFIIKIAKYIASKANFVMPVSNNLKESLSQLGIKTPMKIITNVVSTEVFDISEQKFPKQNFRFLHVSSLIDRKRPLEIIEVVAKLHQNNYKVQLEIGGDGDIVPLQNKIKQLNANAFIEVFGAISYQEVAKKMQNSDCFILFSDNETQGCVILESYACGVPVVSTEVGGAKEFIIENFAVGVEKANQEDLYNKLEKIVSGEIRFADPNKIREYAVENFSQEAIARQFDDIYQQTINQPATLKTHE